MKRRGALRPPWRALAVLAVVGALSACAGLELRRADTAGAENNSGSDG